MLLQVSGVHKAFGPDVVLERVDFRVDRREKVALVGRNGTGKTTLLKILTDQMEPDSGNVFLARGAKVGFLRQEHVFESGQTVLEEAERARAEQMQLRERLDQLEARLEDSPTPEELDEYATLHEHYLELEGYAAERDMRVVLQRMGFDETEFSKSASNLSGGEKTRLALARLLLEQPDLLILDEPTNHLDLQATEWLEGWLRTYPGAVLLVSHDRAFLQNVGDRVLELREGTVKSYPGPFDKFLKLRAEEEARQAEVAKRQSQAIAKLDEYVRRFMNSQRTAQARGRLKMMERLEASRVHAPKGDKGMKAGFGKAKRTGDVVFELKQVTVGYGAPLFPPLDWTVQNGDRWGVIGENGAGKSTLIKAMLGILPPLSGRVKEGANVEVGYFAQDTVSLDPEQSPLDYLVWEFGLDPEPARNLLGRFLISGDDVFRPVKTFSGGEKNKLVLASLTTINPNVLILDEPTNHLDMDSRDALADVLREFTGTLILISHDRHLLREVATKTLDVRRSGVRQWPGPYDDYRRRFADSAGPSQQPVAKAEGPRLSPRELSKEIERVRKAVAEAEDAVHAVEAQQAEVTQRLSVPAEGDDLLALSQAYAELGARHDQVLADWEALVTELERLQAQQEGATS